MYTKHTPSLSETSVFNFAYHLYMHFTRLFLYKRRILFIHYIKWTNVNVRCYCSRRILRIFFYFFLHFSIWKPSSKWPLQNNRHRPPARPVHQFVHISKEIRSTRHATNLHIVCPPDSFPTYRSLRITHLSFIYTPCAYAFFKVWLFFKMP